MVSPLNRKLVRDLLHMKGQAAAVAAVVLCGIASFVSLWGMYDHLRGSREAYYRGYRFADVFASLERAPAPVEARIASLSGVAAVRTRIVEEVVLDVPGLEEPATGRIISVPARRRPILNDLHLRRGRWIEEGRRDEVLVSEAFADANGLAPGDTVGAVLEGRLETLRIVGVAISPEYVYEMGGGQQLPDNRRFGVFWMGREAAAAAFEMEGAFDDVVLTLRRGASEQGVVDGLDRILEPYGGLGAYGREDQVSHLLLDDEIAQNRITATIVPAIFLGVAAFILHIVLSRMVGQQREQIGTLKAFGYADRAVALHYLGMVMAPVLVGAAAGTALGSWLAVELAGVYADFYRFPVTTYAPGAAIPTVGFLISAAAASLGALSAVRRVLDLSPAEAMRPPAPARFRPGPLERFGMGARLSVAARTVLRNLERWPVKAVLSVAGIALATAVLVTGRFFWDVIDHMERIHFGLAERQDVTVTFAGPRSAGARRAVENLPGVLRAEPFRSVAAELVHGHRSRKVAVLGLEADADLRRVVDARGVLHRPPVDGLLLTSGLAEVLEVGAGDSLTVRVLEGERPVRTVVVSGRVEESIGRNAYMELGALHRLLGEGATLSGAHLAVDPGRMEELNARLKRTPGVATVSVWAASRQSFRETFAESFDIATTVLVLFASVIAFGVVYNGARVALSERGRELASLRVLGFTRREVSRMLLGEQAVLTVVGIPLGCAAGFGFCALVVAAYQAELFRLPLVVSRTTYGFAASVVLASAVVSAWVVRRRIDRLDLVEVLKTRE